MSRITYTALRQSSWTQLQKCTHLDDAPERSLVNLQSPLKLCKLSYDRLQLVFNLGTSYASAAPNIAMSADELYFQLLRPSIIHILRAAGFHSTRPSVLDTLCDLFIRYLTLLASSTATHAALNHNES